MVGVIRFGEMIGAVMTPAVRSVELEYDLR